LRALNCPHERVWQSMLKNDRFADRR